ncbi:carbohydrate-binding protein [Cohnella sp. AR92]|nr:carbohydrate-binding protein [Cohnella sp. AR92]
MGQYQDSVPRLGVKPYKHGTEAAHGIAWLGEATYFPQPVGLACTWDEEMLRQVGEAIGTEARGFFRRDPALNGLTLWAPTVDMERDPRWGRNEEAYGEDPVLAGKLAAALAQGIQGDHPFYLRAVASLKHFIGNNNEVDRGVCSVSIDPRNMREYYLKAFEIPFKEGGAQSMMTAYNSVNGVPANLNPQVNGIVKGEWGMNGFVVSDAGDVLGTVNEHAYFDNYKDAVAANIKSGIDSITDDHPISKQAIKDALADGTLTENDLDIALRNTFRVRMRLGEFDPEELVPYSGIGEDVIGSDKHKAVAAEAARKNVVLLKNAGGALPLNAERVSKVAVVGPLADIVYRDWYSGNLPYAVTPLQAIRAKLEAAAGQAAFASGNDRVKLAADGKFVAIRPDGKLAATLESPEGAETFELTDWGWRAHSIVAETTGKYVTTQDDVNVTADSNEIFGWFTKEALLIDKPETGKLSLAAWNNARIGIGEEGLLTVDPRLAVEFSSLGSPEERKAAAEAKGKVRAVAFDTVIVNDGIQDAVAAATGADAAIVFVGNHPLINGKETIDRPDITLPEAQERLIREVCAANPNTIVVIVGSYPFAVNWADEHVPAILYTSHAGPELGNALADVLFGEYAPAGRLNMTWYRGVDQLPDFMDYDIIKGERTYRYFRGPVLYPFGHGLTYSPFEYSGLRLDRSSVSEGGEVTVRVTVRNAGSQAGEEVVQLYGSAGASRVKRPLKQLLGFRRIKLAAGESAETAFTVKASELAFWDVTRDRWCLENGTWELRVGRSSEDIALEASLEIVGETVPPRDPRLPTAACNYDDYEGVVIDECRQGGSSVAAVRDGAWAYYGDASFAGAGVGRFEAKVSSPRGGRIELSAVGPNGEEAIGSLEIIATGGTQAWRTIGGEIAAPAGIVGVRLKLSRDVRVASFRFE